MKVYSFLAQYPRMDLIKSADSFFGTVKMNYSEYMKRGFYKTMDKKAIYVYRIKTENVYRHGVLLSTDIKEIINGKIAKHENTLAAKEQQMLHLFLERGAMIKPILLTYPPIEEIDKLIEESIRPKNRFLDIYIEEDKSRHEIYKVSDEETCAQMIKAFKKVKKCYIADGHHRCTTSVLLYEQNFPNSENEDYSKVFSAYFSFEELKISDYNRVVDAFELVSIPRFIVELSEYVDIKLIDSASNPEAKYQITMYIANEWYSFKWKDKLIASLSNGDLILSDVYIFNEIVLKKILGIEDVRSHKGTKYIKGNLGTKAIENSVNKSANRVGFCFYPISGDELKQIVDNNQILPPKSTLFEPRMKNGMIVQSFKK